MILVLNAGSSTLKYKLFSVPAGDVLLEGIVESIGEQALQMAFDRLRTVDGFQFEKLIAIGHRIVHGGNELQPVEVLDAASADRLMTLLDQTTTLAPLHNPPALRCLEAARAISPKIPQVLVFDTGFFRDLPDAAKYYALPAWCFDQYKIRRYGAHGTSHRYVASKATQLLQSEGRSTSRMITLHLGNGASMAAIRDGRPLDTSMGLTPLEGLVMGTRSGDLDPAIVVYLQARANLSAAEVDRLLNRESGLKGLCGDNDMRMIQQRAEAGDQRAILAIEMYAYRIRKYIGAYTAILEGLDALIFTAGVGQHSGAIRQAVCEPLGWFGVRLDSEKNGSQATMIHAADSSVSVLVVPTDEERSIYDQVVAAVC